MAGHILQEPLQLGFPGPLIVLQHREGRRHHRHFHFVLEARVAAGAKDDIGLRVGHFLEDMGGVLDFLQGEAGAAGDDKEDALGPFHGNVEQGAAGRHPGGVNGPVVAFAAADGQPGRAGVAEDGFDIGEVHIDFAGDGYHFSDGLDALMQDGVGHFQGILPSKGLVFLLVKFQEAVVGDDDDGVGVFLEAFDAFLSVFAAGGGLEGEGAADHGDGQGAAGFGDFADHRGGAGAGAAAHPDGDKDHIGAVDGFFDVGAGFLGGLAAEFGLGAGAEAAGEVLAEGDAVGDVAAEKVLGVGVKGVILDHREFVLIHPADRVAAAAADAEDFDEGDAPGDFRHGVGRRVVMLPAGFPRCGVSEYHNSTPSELTKVDQDCDNCALPPPGSGLPGLTGLTLPFPPLAKSALDGRRCATGELFRWRA